MNITNHTSETYEKILTTFDLKFPRKYKAERLRKGFPSLRVTFEELAIRLHTHTNTWRGNYYGNKKKKYSQYSLNDEVRRQAADLPAIDTQQKEIDVKLTLDSDNCHKTKNGFWLYNTNHIDQVVDAYEQLHE